MQDNKHVMLYVDDDPDYRYAMRQLVELHEMTMIEAGDCEEGLRLAMESSPDLIVLDLMMEEVDSGVNLLRRLRAEGLSAPVYLLSSVGDTMATMIDTSGLGFVSVLQKPFDDARLTAIMKTHQLA